MKLVDAKCPNCNAILKLDENKDKVKCEYCNHTIIVEEAVATYKLKVSGTVSVEGIETNSDLINAANELLDMEEYLKAKKKFAEFSEKCPEKYQGWLGLLICRTRNFTIRDNNIIFENDINKYYNHFLRVAPQSVKDEYLEKIDDYMFPGRIKEKKEVKEELAPAKEETKKDEIVNNDTKVKKGHNGNVANIIFTVFSAIFVFGSLSDQMFLAAILWFLLFFLYLPATNKLLTEKIPFIKKNNKIIKIIGTIVAFLVVCASLDNVFSGVWISSNNEYVNFTEDKCLIGTITLDGTTIKYNQKYELDLNYDTEDDENSDYYNYYINCGDNYKFKYNNDSLCLLKDKNCSEQYMKEEDFKNKTVFK